MQIASGFENILLLSLISKSDRAGSRNLIYFSYGNKKNKGNGYCRNLHPVRRDGFTGYEYVVFGEYSAGVIETITKQTGYYGEIYRYCYCAEQMALEKDTPGNPKGTTGGGSQ